MTSPYVLETQHGGFNFENCFRNSQLQASSAQDIKLKAKKTGTTIAGVVFKDGVVLGADTRATSGEVVSDKNCSKIHYIAPNIFCCGAGTAADTVKTMDMLRSNLTLQSLSMDRKPRLVMACRILQDFLYRHKGQINTMLLLGGVDCTGPHIFTVDRYGSVNKAPFETMGSGSLPALSIFEDGFKPNMSEEEAKQLVRDAITAGIANDLGSGSNVDLCVIRRDGAEHIRPFEASNYRGQRLGKYKYDKGTTPVLSEQTTKLQVDLVEETVQQMEEEKAECLDFDLGSSMDLSVIRRDGAKHTRSSEASNYRGRRMGTYNYDKETTSVLSEQTTKLQEDKESVQPMELQKKL